MLGAAISAVKLCWNLFVKLGMSYLEQLILDIEGSILRA